MGKSIFKQFIPPLARVSITISISISRATLCSYYFLSLRLCVPLLFWGVDLKVIVRSHIIKNKTEIENTVGKIMRIKIDVYVVVAVTASAAVAATAIADTNISLIQHIFRQTNRQHTTFLSSAKRALSLCVYALEIEMTPNVKCQKPYQQKRTLTSPSSSSGRQKRKRRRIRSKMPFTSSSSSSSENSIFNIYRE